MFSIFSFVLVFIYLLCTIKCLMKNKWIINIKILDSLLITYFILYIIVEIFIGVGYFIKIGTFEALFSEFSLAMLFIVCFIRLCIRPQNKKLVYSFFFFFLAITTSILASMIFNYQQMVVSFTSSWEGFIYWNEPLSVVKVSSNSLLLLIRVAMFGIIMISSQELIWNRLFISHMTKIGLKISKIMIVWLIIEFFIKNFISANFYCNLVNSIFGIGAATYYEPIYRNGICCLQGLYKEPSAVSLGLFYVSFILIFAKNIFPKKKMSLKIWLIVSILCSMLSLSLSSLIFICASICLYAFFGRQKIFKLSNIIIFVGLIFAVSIVFLNISYFRTRINVIFDLFVAAFNGNLSDLVFHTTSGEVPRIISVMMNVRYFVNYPLFGLGLGTTYSHSFIPSMLANVGIMGVISWLMFLSKMYNFKKINFPVIIILVSVFCFQGYLGFFYSVSCVFLVVCYFKLDYLKKIGDQYDWNCDCKL